MSGLDRGSLRWSPEDVKEAKRAGPVLLALNISGVWGLAPTLGRVVGPLYDTHSFKSRNSCMDF